MHMNVHSDSELRECLARHDADLYAFDIFDTVIARLLPPEYVKYLVCAFIRRRFLSTRVDLDTAHVYRYRREVEDDLKAQSQAGGYDPEYRYRDSITGLLELMGVGNPDAADVIARYEFDLEDSCIYFHDGVVDVVKDLHARGKKVVFVSDNYMAEADVRWLLREGELPGCVEKVYVSSTDLLRKDTGRLFDHVLEDTRTDPGRMVYVGDNPHSDYKVPKGKGIACVLLDIAAEQERRRALDALLPTEGAGEPSFEAIMHGVETAMRCRLRDRDPAIIESALLLGLPFYAYIESLLAYARSIGVPKVHFLSREGHFFKRIFDRLADGEIASEYLCASRASTYLMSMPELDAGSLNRMFDSLEAHFLLTVSIEQVLKHLNVDTPEVREVVEGYGVPFLQRFRVRSPVSRGRLTRALLDPVIRDAFAARRGKQRSLFADYLKQLGLLDSWTILIADIGWAGSMQTFIADLLQELGVDVAVHGYYFGYDRIWETMKGTDRQRDGIVKQAFVYRGTEADRTEASIVSRIVLELITTAPHGATAGYRSTQSGVEPTFEWTEAEADQYAKRIEPLQRTIEDVVNAVAPLCRALGLVLPEDPVRGSAIEKCRRFLCEPTPLVARHFSRYVLYDDSFGIHREIPFFSGRWWWEATCALRMESLPWRVMEWFSRRRASAGAIALRVFLAVRLFGVGRLARILKQLALRIPLRPGTDYTIAMQYRFRRAGAPVEPAGPRAYVYFIRACPAVAAARRAAGQLALAADGSCRAFYRRPDGRFGTLEVRNRRDTALGDVGCDELAGWLGDCEYIVTTSHAVRFEEDFLEHLDAALAGKRGPDFAYTDNDSIILGDYGRPRLKPDWCPEYYGEYDYIGDVVAVRRESLGGDVPAFVNDVSRRGVHAAMLDRMDAWRRVAHIAEVLYHGPHVARRVSLKRGRPSAAGASVFTGHPGVSIIIPFKDAPDYLERCVASIERLTAYRNFELLLVNNASKDARTAACLKTLQDREHVRVLHYNEPFNYSAINNFAVGQAKHPYLLFLNNDAEILRRGWLTAMLEHAQRVEVGCVGALLRYPDGSVQHGGVVFDFGETYPAAHIFHHEPAGLPGYEMRLGTVQQYSAVTAACMMMRRDVFDEVGGFDPEFRVAYNDLDLCCNVRARGYRIVWTPRAELLHHENVSRGDPLGNERDEHERDMFKHKWQSQFLEGDPFYNPRLHLCGGVKAGSESG